MNIIEKVRISQVIDSEVEAIVKLLQHRQMEVAYTKFFTLQSSMEVLGKASDVSVRLKDRMLSVGYKEWQFDGFTLSYQHIGRNRYQYSGPNWKV